MHGDVLPTVGRPALVAFAATHSRRVECSYIHISAAVVIDEVGCQTEVSQAVPALPSDVLATPTTGQKRRSVLTATPATSGRLEEVRKEKAEAMKMCEQLLNERVSRDELIDRQKTDLHLLRHRVDEL